MIAKNIFRKFKQSMFLRNSLQFIILYSVQSCSEFTFSQFKPVFSIYKGFQLILENELIMILLQGFTYLEQKSVFSGYTGNLKLSEKILPKLGLALEDSLIVSVLSSFFINVRTSYANKKTLKNFFLHYTSNFPKYSKQKQSVFLEKPN